jgi:hypothetical protein
MSKGMRRFLAGLSVTVLGGVIVLVVQYNIFEPAVRAGSEQETSQHATPPSETSRSASPDPVAPVSIQAAQTPVAPVALDNKVITQAAVTVVGDKIAPGVYDLRNIPGYYATVFTAAGEYEWNDGCYVHWELFNNGALVTVGDTRCGLQGGWSTAWWPNNKKLVAGDLIVKATVTNDFGSSTVTETGFSMRQNSS